MLHSSIPHWAIDGTLEKGAIQGYFRPDTVPRPWPKKSLRAMRGGPVHMNRPLRHPCGASA